MDVISHAINDDRFVSKVCYNAAHISEYSGSDRRVKQSLPVKWGEDELDVDLGEGAGFHGVCFFDDVFM